MSNTFTNKERTKWKILSFSLIGILIGSTTTATIFLQIPQQLLNGSVTGHEVVNAPSIVNTAYGAGVLTNVFALPADNLFSTKTYYTIAFTTATAGAIREIEMTFPAGFNVASVKLLEVQGIGTGSLSVSGQTVKYTVTSPVSIPAQRAIKISMAEITNAATVSNQVLVTTEAISAGPNAVIIDGPTNSAVFTLMQVSNAMLTSNSVTAPKMAANSVDNQKIIDGQVTTADLDTNSVDASKIRDGTIGKADVSTAFIKKVTIPDQNNGGTGWDPNGARRDFYMIDTSVKRDSIISINLYPNWARNASCMGKLQVSTESVIQILCDNPVIEGETLTYLLVN